MRITQLGQIDVPALNNELSVALGGWTGWVGSHNGDYEAIVDLQPGFEERADEVRAVIEAHIANAEQREAAKLAQQQADAAALEAVKADQVIRYLVTHTPAECAQYVQTNVTNLATAKDVLGKLAMAVSVLAKKEFR